MTPTNEPRESETRSVSAADTVCDVLFEISHDLLGSANRDGFMTGLNPAWEETLGFSRTALMAQPFLELVHPSDREATAREMVELWTEDLKTTNFRNRCMVRGGGWRWLSWQAEVRNESLYFAAHDVTDEIAAEHESLVMSRMVNGIDEAIFTMTIDGVVTSWNSNCEEIYGFNSAETVGKQLVDLTIPDDRQEEPAEIIKRLLGGEGCRQLRAQRKHKDGSTMTLSETASLIRDENYDVDGVVVVDRDQPDPPRSTPSFAGSST